MLVTNITSVLILIKVDLMISLSLEGNVKVERVKVELNNLTTFHQLLLTWTQKLQKETDEEQNDEKCDDKVLS